MPQFVRAEEREAVITFVVGLAPIRRSRSTSAPATGRRLVAGPACWRNTTAALPYFRIGEVAGCAMHRAMASEPSHRCIHP